MRIEELLDGRIVLIQGDALEVLPRLDKGSVDLIFTDPPYGHNNNDGDLIHKREAALGQSKKDTPSRPIANDGFDDANMLAQFLFKQSARLLSPGSVCCCCCSGGGPDPQFARWIFMLQEEGLFFKQMIVWDKGPIGMGWHYRRSYETILIGQRDKSKCNWYDQTDRIENVIRPGFFGIKKILPAKDHHPTEKPWQLPAFFVSLHTKEDDLVLDPFLGGGSTAEAAFRMRRRFIGIELDPQFFEMSLSKMKKLCSRGTFSSDTAMYNQRKPSRGSLLDV